MAKILFISDNYLNESLGIMCLSAYLKTRSHQVDIALLSEYKRIGDLLRFIQGAACDIIGFSVMTPQVSAFRHVSKIIKETTHHKIIWGGPHCTLMSDEISEGGYVDIICIGEGEEPLLELMNRIDERKEFDDIANLRIKKKNGWVNNELCNLEPDLDRYPFPDRALYYDKYPFLRNFVLKRFVTMRGCPYDCFYCFAPNFKEIYKGKGELVRRHSAEYIIAEIKSVISRYPIKILHFSDDTFNADKDWVMNFLVSYKKNISLPFTCNISVVGIDEEMIGGMKDAGCSGVTFGLESGLEDIRFNVLNKKFKNVDFIETSRLLHKHKIRFVTSMLFCLPNENLENAVESIYFANSLKPWGVRASILKIFKNTKLAKSLLKNGSSEEVGEFTYKSKDLYKDHDKIKNMLWAANLLVKFPLLLPFAKKILSIPANCLSAPLILLSYWTDVIFHKIPLTQAFGYFWNSRKVFIKGVASEQEDVYRKIVP